MVTVHREAGLRFVIFTDDHEPAHVHVIGDGAARISLGAATGAIALLSNVGLKSGELRKAMRIVAARRTEMLEQWRAYHG